MSWDKRHDRENFFSFWGHFLPFKPHYQTRKSKFWKNKKNSPGGIIFHTCVVNDIHMMYSSWDMECNRQNFLSFWTIFCPFTPLTTQKIKIFKKWKKLLDISFYRYYLKLWSHHVSCTVPEIWCRWLDRQRQTDRQTDRRMHTPPKNFH